MEITTRNEGNLGPHHTFPKLTIDSLKLTLVHIHPTTGDCDFTFQTSDLGYTLQPKEEVKVPTERALICDLETDETEVPRVTGAIMASFSYTYEFVRKQELEVIEE
jgi:hypothetical protein